MAAAVPPSPSVVGRDVMGVEPGISRRRPEVTITTSLAPKIAPELLTHDVEFRHISIEGATAFTAQQILPLFTPILDRRVKFAEVVAAVDQVTAMYDKGGHIFYSVNLPPQNLDGDTLHVAVVEGTVANIEVADGIAAEKARQRIHDLLAPLIGKRPVRKAELERRLLLAADTPGAVLSATAKPTDGDPTKVDLVIAGTFERFTPIAQIDSFQTTPDTSVNFRVGAIGRSLAFGGDQLELRYLSALPWNSLHLFDARYGVPVGNDGGRLNFLGQAVLQRPPVTVNGQSLDYLARSLLGRVGYSHPFVRSPKWTLLGFTMVDVIDVDYYVLGFNIPGDSLRVWRGGAGTNVTDDIGGVWTASALASVGLGVADASANGRFSATPTFFKAKLFARARPADRQELCRHAARRGTGDGRHGAGFRGLRLWRPRLRPSLRRRPDLWRPWRGRRGRVSLHARLDPHFEGARRTAALRLRRSRLAGIGRSAQRAAFLRRQFGRRRAAPAGETEIYRRDRIRPGLRHPAAGRLQPLAHQLPRRYGVLMLLFACPVIPGPSHVVLFRLVSTGARSAEWRDLA